MTYTADQIAAHISRRAAAIGENSDDVQILRHQLPQVEVADARFWSHGKRTMTDRLPRRHIHTGYSL